MNIEECFLILELNKNATIEEVKSARIELLQVWHPDKYASNSKLLERAKEKTQKINQAFEILVKHLKASQSYQEYQQNNKSQGNQPNHRNYSQTQKTTDNDIYHEELKRVIKAQEARREYNERRKDAEKRAFRQLKISSVLAVVSYFIFGFVGYIIRQSQLNPMLSLQKNTSDYEPWWDEPPKAFTHEAIYIALIIFATGFFIYFLTFRNSNKNRDGL